MTHPAMLMQMGEFGWIASLRKKWRPGPGGVVGIGDDTAVVPGAKKDVLLTTDMIIEGRHFTRRDASAYEIGRKALAVNLSDIAAMAGVPKFALLAVGLPGNLKISYVNEMLRGISELAKSFNVRIVGGDTNQNDKIVIAVTLVGEVERGRAVYRSGAKKGDWIFVTGSLGGSYASKKHLRFTPRIHLARQLSDALQLHAMMDISDGLLSDMGHICEESRVGAVLFAPQIPLSSKAVVLQEALTDGEDFELLFTVSDKDAKKLLASSLRYLVTPVGRIVGAPRGVKVLDETGRRIALKKHGFDHFKK